MYNTGLTRTVIGGLGMSVEYGRRGLVGVLTPQANTTVEPEFGLEAARVIEVGAASGAFHPIYAMPAADARAALDSLDATEGVEAVVMLGTGMPTLGPILGKPRAGGAPVLSCMLATAWRSVL